MNESRPGGQVNESEARRSYSNGGWQATNRIKVCAAGTGGEGCGVLAGGLGQAVRRCVLAQRRGPRPLAQGVLQEHRRQEGRSPREIKRQ